MKRVTGIGGMRRNPIARDLPLGDPSARLYYMDPDGFPEIIFHYGDPYRIRLGEEWEIQEPSLFAGQITGHFFLENTGRSKMIGIKLMPAAVVQLTALDMSLYTDRVVPLSQAFGDRFGDLA
ncbi:MAG: DUF6597 domain-containing transcriptional factor [Balneolaceae bacterium]|nr:DUF6597 domain-containing transcriptional factor [Balneolaceae bacterium]